MNWKTIFAAGAILFSGILYAQTPNDGDTWFLDPIGNWTAEMAGYIFWDVTNPSSVVYDDESGEELVQPSYGERASDIVITHQTGRAFAAERDSVEGDRRRLTGVIMPNRTVSIQIFEPSELRMFISGRLKQSGGTLQIFRVPAVFR